MTSAGAWFIAAGILGMLTFVSVLTLVALGILDRTSHTFELLLSLGAYVVGMLAGHFGDPVAFRRRFGSASGPGCAHPRAY